MPLDKGEHFGIDSRAAWITPYRIRLDKPEIISYRAVARNPFSRSAQLSIRMVGPDGWKGERKEEKAAAHEETTVNLSIRPPQGCKCRRQAIALELTADGKPFGQVAEALVTIGFPVF